MIQKEKRTQTQKKNFMLLIGISFSLAFLCSGVEAATADNNLIQPLSFNSIVNSHGLINVDGIAFMSGGTLKSTTGKKSTTTPTTDTKDKKVKSGKKALSDQKNSTSRRRAIIDD